MDTIIGVVWLIWTIVIFILYHTLFKVYYFDLARGLIGEVLLSGFIGMIMMVITFKFWWLTAIIIILIGLANVGKTNNKIYLVFAIILAIIVSAIGISANMKVDSNETQSSMILQIEQEFII